MVFRMICMGTSVLRHIMGRKTGTASLPDRIGFFCRSGLCDQRGKEGDFMLKRHGKSVFLAVLVLTLLLAVPAVFSVDPLRLAPAVALAEGSFTISNGVLTKYTGTDADVIIPDTVTSIGDSAFADNIYIENVTIPSGVTSIGKYAFPAAPI